MKSMMKKRKWFASPMQLLVVTVVLLGMAVSFVEPAFAATTPYVQRFSSKPGSPWSYYSSGQGRIAVHDGKLRMDTSSRSALNEAVLTLNLAGKKNVTLNFFQESFGDETNNLSDEFSGHENGDGVSISNNGSKWYTIVNASEFSNRGVRIFSIDLDAKVKNIRDDFNSSFGYTSNFKIKFQQYDDCAYSTDGREWDDITVVILAPNKISVGHRYMLAVRSGKVWAWGNNEYGQLGDGTTTDRSFPVQVSGLSGVTAVSAGGPHSLALKSDGTVWAWGYNRYGQLGDGTGTNQHTPVQVSDITGVTAISAGAFHSLALDSDGNVWAWGYNGYGRLGDGTIAERSSPVQVSGLSGVTAVSAGSARSFAVDSGGNVWAWGNNYNGMLGDGTSTDQHIPVKVLNLLDVVAVSSSSSFSYALKSDGTAWAWGDNGYGQLGDRTTTFRSTPVQVKVLQDIIALEGWGHSHGLALISEGTVWQLRNSIYQVPELSDVAAISIQDWALVAAGRVSCLALKFDGSVYSWGRNESGQLGDSSTINRVNPVQLSFYNTTVDTPLISDGVVAPGTTDHILYRLNLTPELDENPIIEKLTLETGGTYLVSDIKSFKLYYSQDEILDDSDPIVSTKSAEDAGSAMVYPVNRTIPNGSTGYFFLTADISSSAGSGRTISINALRLSDIDINLKWSKWSKTGTLSNGGVQTFDSPEVTIKSHPVSEGIATQGTSGYLLYGLKLKLEVKNKSDVVLTGLELTTGGNYQSTDIAGFTLRYSEDEILDADDSPLAEGTVGTGKTVTFAFPGESEKKNLPAGSTGYLFVTADIADKVNSDLTISVASINFDDIQFQIVPAKVGTPLPAGETHTLYAPPVIEISTPQVSAAQVAQGTGDHILYRITLSVADNSVVLNGLTMTPKGTYTASDIDRFRLYASADGTYDAGDTELAKTDVVSPGENLDFPEFSQAIDNGETIHLFVTADITGPEKERHSLGMGQQRERPARGRNHRGQRDSAPCPRTDPD